EHKQYVLRIDCEGKGEFGVSDDGLGIYWEQEGTGPAHYLQTLGLSLWLELQEVPCIHANALAAGNGAIGIIAPSQTGKTTLTAALLKSGLEMMSDDMMALHRIKGEWTVFPGWPQFRMWPDTALEYAGSDLEALEKVHRRFEKRVVSLEECGGYNHCQGSRPLKRLYILNRLDSDGDVLTIENVPTSEALLNLLQNSMLGDVYRVLGIEQNRFQMLAEMLSGIELKKITYSSGLAHLPRVCEQIMRDSPAI
ncbi:hypothetical protein QQ73_21550, partial [Candidatus Endoriftia persephone str. Guaymas]|nr:hypothetical protein [Candidatus Endoriftia persephone str. Guaymas]